MFRCFKSGEKKKHEVLRFCCLFSISWRFRVGVSNFQRFRKFSWKMLWRPASLLWGLVRQGWADRHDICGEKYLWGNTGMEWHKMYGIAVESSALCQVQCVKCFLIFSKICCLKWRPPAPRQWAAGSLRSAITSAWCHIHVTCFAKDRCSVLDQERRWNKASCRDGCDKRIWIWLTFHHKLHKQAEGKGVDNFGKVCEVWFSCSQCTIFEMLGSTF